MDNNCPKFDDDSEKLAGNNQKKIAQNLILNF